MNEPEPKNESPIDAMMAAPPANISEQAPPIESTASTGTSATELMQSKAAVLAVLFLVTGFLGLPLLWINKKFSSTERIVWAIVVIIYTLILIGIVAAVLMWTYRQITAY